MSYGGAFDVRILLVSQQAIYISLIHVKYKAVSCVWQLLWSRIENNQKRRNIFHVSRQPFSRFIGESCSRIFHFTTHAKVADFYFFTAKHVCDVFRQENGPASRRIKYSRF